MKKFLKKAGKAIYSLSQKRKETKEEKLRKATIKVGEQFGRALMHLAER